MAGVPWDPVGPRHPTSAGCESTACVSVTEVLRVRSQELTRRGELWAVTARGRKMKRRRGARVGMAVGTFPQHGGGRCPVLIPPSCESCVCPPMGVCAWCRGYRPPLGAGTKRPVPSPSRHNSPPGAIKPVAPAGVGEGARGSAVPIRTPGGPHCLYIATEGGAGSNHTCGPRRPRRKGVRGSEPSAGGRRGLEPHACGPCRPVGLRRSARGLLGPRPRSSGPHPGAVGPPRSCPVQGAKGTGGGQGDEVRARGRGCVGGGV